MLSLVTLTTNLTTVLRYRRDHSTRTVPLRFDCPSSEDPVRSSLYLRDYWSDFTSKWETRNNIYSSTKWHEIRLKVEMYCTNIKLYATTDFFIFSAASQTLPSWFWTFLVTWSITETLSITLLDDLFPSLDDSSASWWSPPIVQPKCRSHPLQIQPKNVLCKWENFSKFKAGDYGEQTFW